MCLCLSALPGSDISCSTSRPAWLPCLLHYKPMYNFALFWCFLFYWGVFHVSLSLSFAYFKAQGFIVQKLQLSAQDHPGYWCRNNVILRGNWLLQAVSGFVLGQGLCWDSGAALLIMILFTETLFWLICFEVVILGLGLSLRNWEIRLWPGLWIEWSHRQVARIASSVVCGRVE